MWRIAAYKSSPQFANLFYSHLALFYIHQINRVNSRNDFVMMTAPQTSDIVRSSSIITIINNHIHSAVIIIITHLVL